LLSGAILPLTQFYAYIEIAEHSDGARGFGPASGKELWRGYSALAGEAANFAMKSVSEPADIYPVFRELFAKQSQKGALR
jgi:uncharacterized sporulation protein YeaH/YhbH (DUF444 family)